MRELAEVFISYSWDSDAHKKRVADFANRLSERGINVMIDQKCELPPEGWPRWMHKQVRDSRWVIMVCTETYCRRVTGDEQPGRGPGSNWEGNLITQQIYKNDLNNNKFIPVLFQHDDEKHVPDFVGGTRYNVQDQSDFNKLCRRLGGRSSRSRRGSLDVPRHNAIGRDVEIREVVDLLLKNNNVWIYGMPGLGKSVLASAVAHERRVMERWPPPQQQIYIDLKSASPGRRRSNSAFAMSIVLRHFEPEARPEPPDLCETFKLNVDGKDCLFVIDNVSSPTQIELFLRLMGPQPRALITSQKTMQKDLVYHYPLPLMKRPEIKALLSKAIGKAHLSQKQMDRIIDLLGSLPLAVSLAGNRLATHHDVDIDKFINRIKKQRIALLKDIGDEVGLNVEAILRVLLQDLSEEKAKRWRSLAVFPSMFEVDAAQAVWQMESKEQTADQLSDFCADSLLLYVHNRERYFLHDLMLDVAKSDLKKDASAHTQAYEAFSKYYCSVLQRSGEAIISVRPKAQKDRSVFTRSWGNIRTGHAWAEENFGQNEAARKLCIEYALADVLGVRQPLGEHISWLETGLKAARCAVERDLSTEARLLDELGNAFREFGEPRRALDHHVKAAKLARSLKKLDILARAAGNIGRALWELGRPKPATWWYRKAEEFANKSNDAVTAQGMLDCQGTLRRELGDPDAAIKLHKSAYEAARDRDVRAAARALDNLGLDYLARGEDKLAEQKFEEARKLNHIVGDSRIEAAILDHKIMLHRMREELERAEKLANEALRRVKKLGDSRMEARLRGNLGLILSSKNAHSQAMEEHNKHYKIAQKTGDRWGEIAALDHVGEVFRALGDYSEAENKHNEALIMAREAGHRPMEARALGNLGVLYQARKQHAKALESHQEHLRIASETVDPWGILAALDHLTSVYEQLGDRTKLEAHLREAFKIVKSQPSGPMKARLIERLTKLFAETESCSD